MEVKKKAGQGQYGRVGKEARQEQILEVIGLDDILMQISPCKCYFRFRQTVKSRLCKGLTFFSSRQFLGINGNECRRGNRRNRHSRRY